MKIFLNILNNIIANVVISIGVIVVGTIFAILVQYNKIHLWFLPTIIGVLLIIALLITKAFYIYKDKQKPIDFKFKRYEGESGSLFINIIRDNKPVDLRKAKTIAMLVKNDDVVIISKSNSEFVRISSKRGKVSVFLTSADLSKPGNYKGQLQINYKDQTIRKSDIFDFEILFSVIGKVRQLTTSCIAVSVVSDLELQIKSGE